jgi:hypothetical protein
MYTGHHEADAALLAGDSIRATRFRSAGGTTALLKKRPLLVRPIDDILGAVNDFEIGRDCKK